jgi:hypothetical protein
VHEVAVSGDRLVVAGQCYQRGEEGRGVDLAGQAGEGAGVPPS